MEKEGSFAAPDSAGPRRGAFYWGNWGVIGKYGSYGSGAGGWMRRCVAMLELVIRRAIFRRARLRRFIGIELPHSVFFPPGAEDWRESFLKFDNNGDFFRERKGGHVPPPRLLFLKNPLKLIGINH